MSRKDLFKEAFRYYKRKVPRPDFSNVIDFDSKSYTTDTRKVETIHPTSTQEYCTICAKLGLRDHKLWDVHSFSKLQGFLLINNPFTVAGQQMWIRKCLEVYPRKPQITNLDRHYSNVDDIWSLRNSTSDTERKYLSKLCWATVGYHYNWDDKVYSPTNMSRFPTCLKQLSEHVAQCIGYKYFEAEAAIVNYYNMKSTLGIHADVSEEYLEVPIFSFSFGQTGLFLMGTEDKIDEPTAMFLRSGDIIVMSDKSRRAYHAVPRIMKEDVNNRYKLTFDNDDWISFQNYINQARINISVRQVYDRTKK